MQCYVHYFQMSGGVTVIFLPVLITVLVKKKKKKIARLPTINISFAY